MDTGGEPVAGESAGGEAARRAGNERAWAAWSGYETTSGCACWDETPYVCIPKSARGVGLNPNFYACLCCCLCAKAQPAGAGAHAATGAAK